MSTSLVTKATRQMICKIIGWDLQNLLDGTYPILDHNGRFHSKNSRREKMAGSRMPVAAAFAFWKGDMEAHWMAHDLSRYYKCNMCCDFCLATTDRRSRELSWGDLTRRALWRHTMTMEDENDPSPWTQVPGFKKEFRLLDLLHIVHLGAARDLCASCIVDGLEDGSILEFYGVQTFDEALFSLSHHARLWAKDNKMDLGMGTLTMQRLGREKPHWPFAKLDSRLKAARCRTLIGFLAFLMCRLPDAQHLVGRAKFHAKVRGICCWALCVALSLWSQNEDVVMPCDQVRSACWLARLHAVAYQWLAAECYQSRRLLYKIRPKGHYFQHMVDHHEATKLSLVHLSTFQDEDFMGKARGICRASHGATFQLGWARRYALKRALQWKDMK